MPYYHAYVKNKVIRMQFNMWIRTRQAASNFVFLIIRSKQYNVLPFVYKVHYIPAELFCFEILLCWRANTEIAESISMIIQCSLIIQWKRIYTPKHQNTKRTLRAIKNCNNIAMHKAWMVIILNRYMWHRLLDDFSRLTEIGQYKTVLILHRHVNLIKIGRLKAHRVRPALFVN